MIRPLFVGRTDGRYECVAKDTKGKTIRKGFRLTVKAGKLVQYFSDIYLLSIGSDDLYAASPF